jgi:hypothetical protein
MLAPEETFASSKDLLGAGVNPSSLTLAALNQDPAPLAKLVVNGLSRAVQKVLSRDDITVDQQSPSVVGEIFFAPLGLFDLEKREIYMAETTEAARRIKAANPEPCDAEQDISCTAQRPPGIFCHERKSAEPPRLLLWPRLDYPFPDVT